MRLTEKDTADGGIGHSKLFCQFHASVAGRKFADGANINLTHYVEEMAAKAVELLLEGNEGMMCRYLKCEQGGWNGRSDGYSWGNRKPSDWHPVIHGKLFERGEIALRKQIVEAHRDLLVTQRILDLEDQVNSLVAQVNEAAAAKDQMWERFRHLA